MINILKNLSLISLIGICFYLGTWQIDRGQEKLSIQRDFESQVNTEYSDIKKLVDKPVRYKKLYATGIFDESFFLLDNIVFKRKVTFAGLWPAEVLL